MNERKDYFYGIDLARFVAAVMVAFFHIGYSCWASPTSGGRHMLQKAYTISELAPYTWVGWTGVEIFFVISGVVITNSAEGSSALRFLNGRILRLYPAAWICTTIVAITLLANNLWHGLHPYIASMLLIPIGPWIDGQYWTLGVEIVFYAMIFVMLALGQFHRIGLFAILLTLASVITVIVIAVDPRFSILAKGYWRLTLLNYGLYFALGIFIRLWAVGQLNRIQAGAALLCLVGVVIQTRTDALSLVAKARFATVPVASQWYAASLVVLIGVAAIALSARYPAAFYRLGPKTRSTLRHLGLATYPVYLIHFSLGICITRELVRAGFAPVMALFTTIGVIGLLGWAIARYGEPPIRRALRITLDRIERRAPRYRWLTGGRA
ncbi:acyltransferase family protein [Sphingomonas montanisoli]|uniref:Acyltransferase n=1 Tax=Sphingomonas montanisoli TaxID=2606412 RepID=A0A5D9C2N5_9SPHN|nr:acyltransferase [Sphingomonas montanisoli]TZG25846.1 acyltransferase [Sphingomonas montanisoli]